MRTVSPAFTVSPPESLQAFLTILSISAILSGVQLTSINPNFCFDFAVSSPQTDMSKLQVDPKSMSLFTMATTDFVLACRIPGEPSRKLLKATAPAITPVVFMKSLRSISFILAPPFLGLGVVHRFFTDSYSQSHRDKWTGRSIIHYVHFPNK